MTDPNDMEGIIETWHEEGEWPVVIDPWAYLWNLVQYDRGVACADRIIGTCSTLENELEEDDDEDNDSFLAGVDETAFRCNECNWWCEIGEATASRDGGEDVCQDCAPEEEED